VEDGRERVGVPLVVVDMSTVLSMLDAAERVVGVVDDDDDVVAINDVTISLVDALLITIPKLLLPLPLLKVNDGEREDEAPPACGDATGGGLCADAARARTAGVILGR
jgi:hypothetical protein